MKNPAILLVVLGLSIPAAATTHRFDYNMPCKALWPAVDDTLRNSGKYGIIGIDNGKMTASYNLGAILAGMRINYLALDTIPTGCELQVQTRYSGMEHNDAGDLKKRVDESIVKLKTTQPATPTTPASAAPATPAAFPEPPH